MNNKEIKNNFALLKSHLENSASSESLEAVSEELEKQFNFLREIINENDQKKSELEKSYSNEIEELMGQLFEQTLGEMKSTESLIEERNEIWRVTEEKMQVYSNLKENLKKMMSFTNQGFRKSWY